LSPRYAAWKAKKYPGRKILERTGGLKRSITTKGGAGNVRRMTATTMELGTSDKSAQYHQSGTARMPRRQVIDLTPEDVQRWYDLADAWAAQTVATVFGGAGAKP